MISKKSFNFIGKPFVSFSFFTTPLFFVLFYKQTDLANILGNVHLGSSESVEDLCGSQISFVSCSPNLSSMKSSPEGPPSTLAVKANCYSSSQANWDDMVDSDSNTFNPFLPH